MESKVPLTHSNGNSTEIAEIKAFTCFLESFLVNYGDIASKYSINVTDLKTKLQELPKIENHYLIFFLYHPCSEFSIDFCTFLLNPDILSAFESNKFLLYAWDIDNKTLLDDLRTAFFEQLNVYYRIDSTSMVYLISWQTEGESFKPCIRDIYVDVSELTTLCSLLVNQSASTPLEGLENEVALSSGLNENTVETFQQRMRSFMGNREYNSYDYWEHNELKRCVGYALFGPPMSEGELGYEPEQKRTIERLYELIRKENNNVTKWTDRIVISYIFVCIEPLPKDKKKRLETAKKKNLPYKPAEDYVPFPLFVIRKCKKSADPCRIVIDHEGRVYESWRRYLKNNKLPPSLMVYPKDGRYPPADFDGPFLCKRPSPACDTSTKIAEAMDVTAGLAGMVAGGASAAVTSTVVLETVPFLVAAAPVALPVAAAAGIGTAVYTVGRAVYCLVDRITHKQNISLTNSESRAAYLNLAMAICSAATLGTSKLVSVLANEGIQFGTGAKCLIFTVNGIGVTVSGVGIGNSVYELIRSKEITPLAFCQLAASILFFLHSVYTIKCIQENLGSNNSSDCYETLVEIQEECSGTTVRTATLGDMGQSLGDRIVNGLCKHVFTIDNGQLLLQSLPKFMDRIGQTNFMESFPPLPENTDPQTECQINSDINDWLIRLSKTSISGYDNLWRGNITEILLKDVFCGFEKFVSNYVMELIDQFFNGLNGDLRMFAEMTIVTTVKWVVNRLMNMNIIDKIKRCAKLTQEENTTVTNSLRTDYTTFIANINEEIDSITHTERKRRRHEHGKRRYHAKCKSCTGFYFQ